LALLTAGLMPWSAPAFAEITPLPNPSTHFLIERSAMADSLPDFSTVAVVNRQVNQATRYEHDLKRYGRSDMWAEANGSGDCEDFALEKRRRLRELGVAPEAMRIVTARARTSQFGPERGHAVLVVMTTAGEWVLDMTGEPSRKQDLDYRWLKIQKGRDGMR